MALRRLSKDESGIALFMVIAAMTILSVLVTEFTYVAQVNSRMAFDSTDQIKAHYLAKTGLKISLLRLKAYKELKALGSGGGAGGMPQIPKQILDKVWSFPFVYPLPNDLPGMTVFAKDEIAKFEGESSLEGRFSATIEPESDKVNLNSIIAEFAPALPSPSPSPTNSGRARRSSQNPSDPNDPNPNPSPSASVIPYDVKEARESMKRLITQLIEDKAKNDPDFANEYGSLQIEELWDNLLGWVDFTHQPRNASGRQTIPYKKGPFYNISELRMIYPIDDTLYDLLAPNFTTALTRGLNVNTLKEPMLRAFFPQITDEEVTEFFKFRDSVEEDNSFKTPEDFWKYVEKSFGAYRNTDELKTRLAKQGIPILTDEETFKITVIGQVNQATRVIEAWVTMEPAKKSKPRGSSGANPAGGGQAGGNDPNNPGSGANPPTPTGLRITFMRES